MNDDELEAMFRASLTNHASEAVPAADPVASAYAGARRRRRRLIGGIAGAAATVLIAPAAVLAVTLGQGGSNVADPGVPGGWRVESYNGIELRVPPTWGWGASPATPGPNHCLPVKPYVGRPMGLGEDDCLSGHIPSHVWFDSPEPVGSQPGETTVHVKGLTEFNITVADSSASDRQRILDSIHRVTTDANGCSARPGAPSSNESVIRDEHLIFTSVCMYFARGLSRPRFLYYSTRVGASASTQAVKLIEASRWPRNLGDPACLTIVSRGFSMLTLVVHGADPMFTYWVNPVQCGGHVGYDGPDGFFPMRKASARLWAVDGIPVYAVGRNLLTHFLPGS
jgi:hypothetical protein